MVTRSSTRKTVVEKRPEKRKQPTDNSAPEVKKRKSKVLSKKERKTLVQPLESIDTSILLAAVTDNLKEQHLSAKLKGFIDVLLQNNQPVTEIYCTIVWYRSKVTSHSLDIRERVSSRLTSVY